MVYSAIRKAIPPLSSWQSGSLLYLYLCVLLSLRTQTQCPAQNFKNLHLTVHIDPIKDLVRLASATMRASKFTLRRKQSILWEFFIIIFMMDCRSFWKMTKFFFPNFFVIVNFAVVCIICKKYHSPHGKFSETKFVTQKWIFYSRTCKEAFSYSPYCIFWNTQNPPSPHKSH